ncbi:Nucleosomal histone H3-Lys79 methylase [Oleoguttula sp. CCFEE 5521]
MNPSLKSKNPTQGSTGRPRPTESSTHPQPKRQPLGITARPTAPPKSTGPVARPPSNRFQLSTTTVSRQPALTSRPAKTTADSRKTASTTARDRLAPGPRGVKRKSETPQPAFSDDDGSTSASDSDSHSSASMRKRPKSSISSIDTHVASRRNLVADGAAQPGRFIHGRTLTASTLLYKPAMIAEDSVSAKVGLQYPSASVKEYFELKVLKRQSDNEYKPMDDIEETIRIICHHYLPERIRRTIKPGRHEIVTDRYETVYSKGLLRAKNEGDVEKYIDIIEDFNKMLKAVVEDGSIQRELRGRATLPLDWFERIHNQIYSRTVSLHVESLKQYETGTDDVYGELLPSLVDKIINVTQLSHDQIFVDLGSGVGNIVLQTALQVGCESWGIEQMPNPCKAAELQKAEFAARTRLWGLTTGQVNLINGSFFECPEIDEVLKRADVVLVNNQVFSAATNDSLLAKFLDLKEGAKVVSLKPFVPKDHRITKTNINSMYGMFRTEVHEYFDNSVSWVAYGGEYHVAIKDSSLLRKFGQDNGMG